MGSIGYPYAILDHQQMAAGTYYIEVGIEPALVQSIMISGDAVVAVTSIAFRSTNKTKEVAPPPAWGRTGIPVAADGASTARDWFTEPAIAGIAVAAGAVWSQMIHVGNLGCGRLQMVLVIATAGQIDIAIHGRE